MFPLQIVITTILIFFHLHFLLHVIPPITTNPHLAADPLQAGVPRLPDGDPVPRPGG